MRPRQTSERNLRRGGRKTAAGIVACVAVLAAIPAVPARARAGAPDYDDYAAVLSARVDSTGRVDYAGLAAHRGQLDAFVASLAALDSAQVASWSRDDRLAFWINAYNALALRLVVDHYPITKTPRVSALYPANSIWQIPGAFTDVTFDVAGKTMSLDHIEKAVLHARFSDPRIHMALVCAARSCPPLRREPYRGDRLDRQFDDQARRFLADARNLAVDRARGVLHLSSIFDWFGDDFVARYGGDIPRHGGAQAAVVRFVARYVDDADREFLLSGTYTIDYIEYDWTLNEQGH